MSASRRSSASAKMIKPSSSNPMQSLQAENESLRQEIANLKHILSLPIDETHRSTHLRYQIYSLEKQIALLTRLLDAKREAVATCETILLELNQCLQDFKEKIHRKEPIEESTLQAWIDRIESNRKKSYKSMQDHASLSDGDTLYAPQSVAYVNKEPIHLLEVCSGKIDHLNLKHIAQLESSLCDLHADLRSFHNELLDQTNPCIFPHLHTNLIERSNDLSKKINKSTHELFYLSILVPTRHQKCSFTSEKITAASVCHRINDQFRLSPNIKLYLQSLIDALICSFNHEINLLKSELSIKNRQLSFYRQTLTQIHGQHIQNLVQILSTGQQAFNKQLQVRLYEPLLNIVTEFNRMTHDKTDEALKSFVFTFKIHIDRFNEVIRDLYEQITDGSKAIEQVFMETNEQMWADIDKQQKQLTDQIASIKQKQMTMTNQTALEELSHLLQI